jgi:hypothetical protein
MDDLGLSWMLRPGILKTAEPARTLILLIWMGKYRNREGGSGEKIGIAELFKVNEIMRLEEKNETKRVAAQ